MLATRATFGVVQMVACSCVIGLETCVGCGTNAVCVDTCSFTAMCPSGLPDAPPLNPPEFRLWHQPLPVAGAGEDDLFFMCGTLGRSLESSCVTLTASFDRLCQHACPAAHPHEARTGHSPAAEQYQQVARVCVHKGVNVRYQIKETTHSVKSCYDKPASHACGRCAVRF